VQLDLFYDKNHVLPMLKKILPLISSIYSIKIRYLFDWIYDSDQEYQDNNNNVKELKPLLNTMLAQTKILAIKWLVLVSDLCFFVVSFEK
jgi:hypothetical protein